MYLRIGYIIVAACYILLLQFVGKQVLGYTQNLLKPRLLPFNIYSFIALVMGDVEKKKSPSLLLYLQLIHTSQSRPIQSACTYRGIHRVRLLSLLSHIQQPVYSDLLYTHDGLDVFVDLLSYNIHLYNTAPYTTTSGIGLYSLYILLLGSRKCFFIERSG